MKYGRPLMNRPKLSPLFAAEQFAVSDGGKIVLVAGVVPFTKPNAQPLNVDPNTFPNFARIMNAARSLLVEM